MRLLLSGQSSRAAAGAQPDLRARTSKGAEGISYEQRALVVSQLRGEPCCYEECWLAATLLPVGDQLAELLAPAHEAIKRYPDLAGTVAAFAESNLSQSAAARRLGIHTNTVGYRLTRWSELTGGEPRSAAGLVLSLAALETHHPVGQ